MLDKLTNSIKDAMRAKDKLRTQTLRSILNDFTNAGIDKKGREGLTQEVASPAEFLTSAEMIQVLQSAAKRRRESAEQYLAGHRQDLADKENVELLILAEFLPQALSAVELEVLIKETIAEIGATSMAEMGLVMKAAQPKIAGRADGKAISAVVRELLG
jgi:uncharacterized protein